LVFLEQKPIPTGLAQFFPIWLGFFSLARFFPVWLGFFSFGLVWLGFFPFEFGSVFSVSGL
jgi:hypothetical protein